MAEGEAPLATLNDAYTFPQATYGISVSPAGDRVVYVAKLGAKEFVVVDGVPGPPYENIRHGAPVWSPDGRRLAYVASEQGEAFVVLDGRKGQSFPCGIRGLTFTSDGADVAFVTCDKNFNQLLVVGKQTIHMASVGVAQAPIIGSDGSVASVVSEREDKNYVVLNGAPEPTFNWVGGLAFSPDGAFLAYAAGDEDSAFVVSGKQRGPSFKWVGNPTFTPRGELAYVGVQADKGYLVVAGQRSALAHAISGPSGGEGRLAFSADGSVLAYVGVTRRTEKRFVVTRGMTDQSSEKNGPEFDHILGSPLLSSDGTTVAYVASVERGIKHSEVAVANEVIGPPFDRVWPVGFARSGEFVYAALQGNQVLRKTLRTQ